MNVENREVNPKLIAHINELKTAINEISVYDLNTYTAIELYSRIANKLNEVIGELLRYEITVSEQVVEQNNCLQYLLNEGLTNEVINKINNMVIDGTMDLIINQNVLKDLNSQIKAKANLNEVFIKEKGININDFDEQTRQTFLNQQGIDVNYILGDTSVKNRHLEDKSVSYLKTKFFDVDYTINKYNYKKAYIGYVINSSTGELVQHENGYATDFIKVNENDVIRSLSSWEGAFYDINHNFISGKAYGVTEITAPSGARYYREGMNDSLYQSNIITINSELPKSFVEYNEYPVLAKELKESIENIIDNFISKRKIKPNETTFLKTDKTNLYSKDNILLGYAIDTDGDLKTNEHSCATDFIKVEGNTQYFISSNWNGCFYDKHKLFISQKEFGTTSFTTPSNCEYIRLSIPKDQINDYILSNTEIIDGAEYNVLQILDKIDINTLPNQLHIPLRNKKWVVVGDSLTERNNRTTKHYYDYVSEETGVTVYNMGVSGTGYKRTEESNTAFYQRIANIPTDADIITIFGSGNDLSLELGTPTDTTTDTICGCMNKTFQTLFSIIPGAKVGVVLPCPWGAYPPTVQDNKMMLYVEALREVAKRYSIPVLDLYYNSNLRPWDSTFKELYYKRDEGNSVHPDEDGHKILANKFKMFIQSL